MCFGFVLYFFFFFNDTSTPQIYTYLHTLSLHDSLPIFKGRGTRPDKFVQCHHSRPHLVGRIRPHRSNIRPNKCGRSDEHTSELQSLMRTSYAVFCLQKTNTISNIPHNNKKMYNYHNKQMRKHMMKINKNTNTRQT